MRIRIKNIVELPYGSPNQIELSDFWYERFASFAQRHPILIDEIWDGLHLSDVIYQARRRWIERHC